jgi:hypothetical protein
LAASVRLILGFKGHETILKGRGFGREKRRGGCCEKSNPGEECAIAAVHILELESCLQSIGEKEGPLEGRRR